MLVWFCSGTMIDEDGPLTPNVVSFLKVKCFQIMPSGRAIATFETKYPKAVHWRTLDTDALLAFHDFGAEHWVHLRTSNPIPVKRVDLLHGPS